MLLVKGKCFLSYENAAALFGNRALWRHRCLALSQKLQDCVSGEHTRISSVERDEIENIHSAARERSKRTKIECNNSALSLANAPPCVKCALPLEGTIPSFKNDARFHLGTICSELMQICSNIQQASLLIEAVRDLIEHNHGKQRASHFYYHATRPSFNRKCVTMVNAPIKCTASPELCIRERNIAADPQNLSPAIVWAHMSVKQIVDE